jgi:hypothetical protein
MKKMKLLAARAAILLGACAAPFAIRDVTAAA